MTDVADPERPLTVLVVDDIESQARRIQERLRPFHVHVEWRGSYREAAERLRQGAPVHLVLIDQMFDVGPVPVRDLLTASDVDVAAARDRWDVRLHQGLFILARLRQDMREGRVPVTPAVILSSHSDVELAAQTLGTVSWQSKPRLLADPYGALRDHLPGLRSPGGDQPHGIASMPEPEGVLLRIGARGGASWPGPVMDAGAAGELCTLGPTAMTVWAPAGEWWRAFSLVALCKSAVPERCIVLSDELPPPDLVPRDGRVALPNGAERCGTAAFTCADLRGDRVFRLLLAGRARQHPELERLLALHVLARTPRGAGMIARWHDVLRGLFAGDPPERAPEQLRFELQELATAATRGQRVITGGFHALHPEVRGPADWEAGARTYLPLAAAQSPRALTAVDRWLAAEAGWDGLSPARQRRRRRTAARLLHRLVDDPWPVGSGVAELLGPEPTP